MWLWKVIGETFSSKKIMHLLSSKDGEYSQIEGAASLQRDGFGHHVTTEGLQYTGHWQDDKMNGKGEIL